MPITRAKADTYFESHVRGPVWSGFGTTLRDAAIAHAKRLVSRFLRDNLDTDDTTDADFPRHDCAVYEQALHLLENGPSMSSASEQSLPVPISTDPGAAGADKAKQADPTMMSKEALRYLNGMPSRGGAFLTLERG